MKQVKAVLMALALYSGTALSQVSSLLPTIQAPPLISSQANKALSTITELEGGHIAGYVPIYVPRTSQIAYYEVKITGLFNTPKGSLIFNPAGKLKQFTTTGPSKFEQLKQQTSAGFRMVRMGAGYFAGEDQAGNLLAEIGRFPRPYVKMFANELATTGHYQYSSVLGAAPPPPIAINPLGLRTYSSKTAAYHDYATNYLVYFKEVIKASVPARPLTVKEEIEDNNWGGTGSSTERRWVALGTKPARWTQVKPGEEYSDKDWKTGCGPTAFMNLFAWHDINWARSLFTRGPNLPFTLGTKNDYDEYQKAGYTKHMRDYLGTFNSPGTDMGATWPWHMERGFEFARNILHHTPVYEASYKAPTDDDATAVLKSGIKNYGKPGIVGYWDDVHYDLAYKYSELQGLGYFFTVDKDNLSGEAVNEDDIFYGAVAYDFQPTHNHMKNGNFEAGWEFWNSEGNAVVSIRNPSSRRGTAHARLSSDNGGTQRMWQTLYMRTDIYSGYKFSAYIRTTPNVTFKVRYYQAMLPGVLGDNVIKEQTFPASPDGWRLIEMDLPVPALGMLGIEFVASAPAGQYSSTRIDDVWLSAAGGGGSSTPPHEACVPGKRGQDGYDEGCPELN